MHKFEKVLLILNNKTAIENHHRIMTVIKTKVLPVLLSTVWISISEFVRNELLLKSFWVEHYKKLGLVFPSAPINGIVLGLWSFLFAISIFIISKKFSLTETTFISWFVGFVLMWVVIGNMNVLPYGILIYAIPLSLLEVFVAALIIKKLS